MDENHILLLNVVYHLRLIQHDLHYFFAAKVQTELIKKIDWNGGDCFVMVVVVNGKAIVKYLESISHHCWNVFQQFSVQFF